MDGWTILTGVDEGVEEEVMAKNGEGFSLGGLLLKIAIVTPIMRVLFFHSMPWSYAFFPALVWIVSLLVRAFVISRRYQADFGSTNDR